VKKARSEQIFLSDRHHLRQSVTYNLKFDLWSQLCSLSPHVSGNIGNAGFESEPGDILACLLTKASHKQVGASPTGLIMTLTLLKQGISCRIIEKSFSDHVRTHEAGIVATFHLNFVIRECRGLNMPPIQRYEYPGWQPITEVTGPLIPKSTPEPSKLFVSDCFYSSSSAKYEHAFCASNSSQWRAGLEFRHTRCSKFTLLLPFD
jgi:hypothetical protein